MSDELIYRLNTWKISRSN